MKKYFSKEFLLKVFYSFVWVALLVFIADIVSKWCVQSNLTPEELGGKPVAIIPNFLYVTLIYNTNAAFSLGGSETGWRIAWIIVSVVLTVVLIFIYYKYFKKFSKTQKIALVLMIGGAFSNLIDRAFYWTDAANGGPYGVIDWIDFHFGNWRFPTFNVADSCLVIGVIMLILVELIALIKEVREKDKRGEYDIAPQPEKKDNEDNQNK